jgi:hypothetical protein
MLAASPRSMLAASPDGRKIGGVLVVLLRR